MAKQSIKIDKNKMREAIIIKSLQARASGPIKKIKAIKRIKTNADTVIVLDNLKILKELKAEGMRELHDIVDPIKGSIRKIETLFQPFFALVKGLETDRKEEVYQFLEKREKAKLELDQQYAKGKVNGVQLMKKKDALAVDSGNATIAKVWTAVCEDESKTPRTYMVPDEAAIREALKEGKKVAGWSWRQVNNVRI